MKTIKGLLLGAAAALSMGSVASAADLPAAEPVEYVRICDAYGAGFFFIPGTDTCLRISGLVRVQAYYHTDNISQTATGGGTNYTGFGTGILPRSYNFATGVLTTPFNDTVDQLDMGVRALLRFDARSRTEWGVLRSFFEFAADSATNAINGSALQIRYGFVQFGPITAGLTDSFFNFDGGTYYGDVVGDRTSRVVTFAYTAAFGNGLSATVALEDATVPSGGNQAQIGGTTGGILATRRSLSTTAPDVFTAADLGGAVNNGSQLPDLVGNIRISQAWGTAQLSGAIGQRRYVDTSAFVLGVGGNRVEWDDTVWAIKGGLRINLDMLSRGSHINLQAAYGEGASNYVFTGDTRNYWQGLRLADGTRDETQLYRIDSWSLFANVVYFFTPALRGSLYAGYAELEYNGPASALFNSSTANAGTVLLDRTYQIGANLQWTPVRNLDLGLDVFYTNARYSALYTALPGNANAGRVDRFDEDAWGAIFRIQRSF